LAIIDYIRSTVEILVNIKQEDQKGFNQSTNSLNDTKDLTREYERMLQSAEEELRNHVRVSRNPATDRWNNS